MQSTTSKFKVHSDVLLYLFFFLALYLLNLVV